MKSFKKFLIQTNSLMAWFIVLSLSCAIILGFIAPNGYSGRPIEDLLAILFLIFGGCAGLPLIIRREFSFFSNTYYGIIPVIIGLFFLIPGWSIGIILLIKVIPTFFK